LPTTIGSVYWQAKSLKNIYILVLPHDTHIHENLIINYGSTLWSTDPLSTTIQSIYFQPMELSPPPVIHYLRFTAAFISLKYIS
jgi:hypothetical protein